MKNLFVPDQRFEFPKSLMYEYNHSSKKIYLFDSYVYSRKENGTYSMYHAVFLPDKKNKSLASSVSDGCKQRNKFKDKDSNHINGKHNDNAVKKARILLKGLKIQKLLCQYKQMNYVKSD